MALTTLTAGLIRDGDEFDKSLNVNARKLQFTNWHVRRLIHAL